MRISDSGNGFVLTGSNERFTPWGFNYVGDFGRIVEEYWEDDWARVETDFREMRSLGANVVRLHLQVGTYMTSPNEVDPDELRRLRKTLDLADDVGLYVDLTGLGCYHLDAIPAWFDKLPESERWQVQAKFWEAVAKTCAGHPAVFCYDLMNEPVIGTAKEGDHPWLLGELEGFYFVQRISNQPGDRSREEIAAAWVEMLVSAIRKHDREHLVTVGVIPWALPFPGAKPVFYAPEGRQTLGFCQRPFLPEKGGGGSRARGPGRLRHRKTACRRGNVSAELFAGRTRHIHRPGKQSRRRMDQPFLRTFHRRACERCRAGREAGCRIPRILARQSAGETR